jgi:hypothetical protein
VAKRLVKVEETREEWWSRREEFFRQLDRDELINALLRVQWREVRRRKVPRHVMAAARAMMEWQESPVAHRLNEAVADLPELTVRGVKRRAQSLFRDVALSVGQFGLSPQEEMLLVGMILQLDDDDGDEGADASPDKPRTPATVE